MDTIMAAMAKGTSMPAGSGCYVHWAPGGGPELWVPVDGEQQILGVEPRFVGPGRMRLGVIEVRVTDPVFPWAALVVAWINPVGQGGEGKVAVEVGDYARHRPHLAAGTVWTMQVSAFAESLVCYPDDAAYRAAQPREPRFAPRSFLPTGLWAPGLSPAPIPEAEATFSGHILAASRPINPATGRGYVHLLVATYGGTVDVVAEPSWVEGTPVVGGVVKVSAWLAACMVEREEAPPR